jgi:hypothetical protein
MSATVVFVRICLFFIWISEFFDNLMFDNLTAKISINKKRNFFN